MTHHLLPDVDLAELAIVKEENRKQRLLFIDQHAAWLKRTTNKEWSGQQAKVVDQHKR